MAYGGGRGGGGRQQYDNNLSGALFQNDRQEKDGDPDMKGQCEVDGVEYWLAAWWNKTKDGVEYLKFKMSPKDANGGGDRGRGGGREPYGPGNRAGNARGPGQRLNPGRRGPNSDQRDDRGYDDRSGGRRSARDGDRHPNAPPGDEMDDDIPF